MNTAPLVSVMTPVYSVERYLMQVLDNVLAQVRRDLKIVVVDDNPTDGSGELCDEHAHGIRRLAAVH